MSRNAPLYSKEDLKVLNMFKEEYRRLVDSKQRDAMLRTKIFPSMFNHWKEKPDCFPEEEKELRLKELKRWIINNWRPHRKAGLRRRGMTYIDILCRTQAAEVEAEVKVILEQEGKEVTQQNMFQQRRRAAKRVYERLSDSQKEAIDATAKAQAASGNPTWLREIQGEKGAWKSAQKWSRDAWLDMGVLSVTFFALIKPNKHIAVDICDDIATHVNARQSFVQKHTKEVEDIKNLFIEYVKGVYPRYQAMKAGNAEADGSGNSEADGSGKKPVAFTPLSPGDLYPSLAGIELGTLSKKQLVKVMRDYFRAQYMLATGGKYKRIPYARLEKDPSVFIDAEYYPPTVSWMDPQNMQMEDIQTLLSHIKAREIAGSNIDAFRFKRYWDGRKLCDAAYADLSAAAVPSCAPTSVYNDLQGSGESPTILTEITGGLSRSTIIAADPQNPMITPMPTMTVPKPTIAMASQGNGLINQETMSRLTELGIPTSIPINGPGDGQPMYYMPQTKSGLSLPDSIDPTLLTNASIPEE